MKKYFQGFISATSEKEAHKILVELLENRLVGGGQIIAGESNHWWQGEIERLPYWTIMVFTKPANVDEIIEIVEEISKDDVPGITFLTISRGNKNFLAWVEEETKGGK